MLESKHYGLLRSPQKPMTEAVPQPPLGAIIARRAMSTRDGRTVDVSIGQPVHLGDGWDWACPYRIEGLGTAIEGCSFGIDALQALQLVTPSVRGALQESQAPLLGMDGSGFWQAGFPLVYGGYGDAELEQAMIAAADRVIETHAAKASRRAPNKV